MTPPTSHATRTVLLTGATGTVGGAVLDALADTGRYQVHAVVRREIATRPNVTQRIFDLSDPRFPENLADTEYDGIIHCAQPRYDQGLGSTTEDFDLRVVRGLERLCTARTSHLLYTGGVWVYGHQPRGSIISEDSPLNPIAYSAGRIRTLGYLRTQSRHPWIEVVLPSLVYGAMDQWKNLRDAFRARSVLAVDDDSILWSLIERSDAGRAYRYLLETNLAERLFVVAEPDPIPIARLYGLLAAELGAPFSGITRDDLARSVSKEDFEVRTMSQPVDSSLIRRRTGWQNRHTFVSRYKALLPAR